MLSRGHRLIDACQNLSNNSLLQKKNKKIKGRKEGRKQRETKEEATCPHICQRPSVPGEAIDPCGAFAHVPGRHRSNTEDLRSCLTTWPLMFPSREGAGTLLLLRGCGGVGKSNETPQQTGLKMYAPPFGSRALPSPLSEDARINIHFSAAGWCVN